MLSKSSVVCAALLGAVNAALVIPDTVCFPFIGNTVVLSITSADRPNLVWTATPSDTGDFQFIQAAAADPATASAQEWSFLREPGGTAYSIASVKIQLFELYV